MAETQRSDVFHYEGLDFWGPYGRERIASVVSLISPPKGGRALDVGCGSGRILKSLARAHDVEVVGLDHSAAALAQAEILFSTEAPQARRSWHQTEVEDFQCDPSTYDVVVWLGGPYIGDGFPETVETLRSWLRPSGFLLLGHGFWHQEPHPDYTEATGIPSAELVGHADNIDIGREAGLVLLYTCVSTRDEWDRFEGRILYNFERYAAAHPEEDLNDLLARKRGWNDAQQRWGRETMGFGLYLFQVPP